MRITTVLARACTSLLKRTRSAPADGLPQLLRDGAAHNAEGRAVEAERAFRAALRIASGHRSALNGLGLALKGQDRLDDAEDAFSRAIEGATEAVDAHFNLGLVHHMRGRFDLAFSCFRRFLDRNSSDADAIAAAGCALERMGKFEKAESYFATAAQLSPKSYSLLSMLRFSSAFLREIDGAEQSCPALPTLIAQSGSGNTPRLVTLVTCDAVYFRKYGRAFVKSFAKVAQPDALLHFHLLDPDNGIVAEVEALFLQIGLSSYRITVEHDTRFAAGSRGKHVWFTCARFIHLEAWLRAYAIPIVLLDVDMALQAPPMKLVETVGERADLGLYNISAPRAPWLDIGAGVVVARPTAQASSYARLVRKYIEHFLSSGRPKWHLDQVALYCTYRMLEACGGAPCVCFFKETADAAVYHVGHQYDERMADGRYGQFS